MQANKRKQPEAETQQAKAEGTKMEAAQQGPSKAVRLEPGGASSEARLQYQTNPQFLASLLYTRADQLRVPENRVFVAERTDKVVDVFKGLIKHNFLSVPVLMKTGHKYYGFLDMGDIVQYVCDHFGAHRLSSSEDFWNLVAEEEAFQEKTVNDIMKGPRTLRNPFHPIKSDYSLLYAIEALAKDPQLHRLTVIDDNRRIMNLLTQSQVVEFLQKNLNLIGSKKDKPLNLVTALPREVFSIKMSQQAIEAFQLMESEVSIFHTSLFLRTLLTSINFDLKGVSGVAVVDDETGKLMSALSLRDLKAITEDGRLFWRLFQKANNFIRHLKADLRSADERPRSVVFCKMDNTLGDVINMCAEHKIHRVFIVDDEKKPISVVSLKDVLLELISA
ncbi:CBS domain containing protein, variant 2 [Balamuthia mandrillaris]